MLKTCPECHGTGEYEDDDFIDLCPECEGEGVIEE